MKKIILILFILFSFKGYSQTWDLSNTDLTIDIVKNGGTTFKVGKWLSNFAVVGDSVSIIYQRNQDNSHFILYLDKDSVNIPAVASATALYDTLVKWTTTSSSGLSWETVTVDTQQVENNKGYIINSANLCVLTLPATSKAGDLILVVGKSSNGWQVTQNSGQQIFLGSLSTALGAGSGIKSTNAKDCAELVCITDDTEWNVRNISPNSTITTFIPFPPDLLWLDAALGVTESGGSVSAWADQSGAGNNATQGTGGNQPQIVNSVINSLPVIRFGGVDDHLTFASSVIPVTAHTIFIVTKARVTHDGFLLSTYNTNGEFFRFVDNAGTLKVRYHSNGNSVDATVPSPSAFHVYSIKVLGTSGASGLNTIYIDGANTASGTFQLAGAGTTLDIGEWTGGGLVLDGDIAEIMIYNSALSDPDRQGVETYLANKYGL